LRSLGVRDGVDVAPRALSLGLAKDAQEGLRWRNAARWLGLVNPE
jgi:hypothetical protein